MVAVSHQVYILNVSVAEHNLIPEQTQYILSGFRTSGHLSANRGHSLRIMRDTERILGIIQKFSSYHSVSQII